jgi:hypothetical protein
MADAIFAAVYRKGMLSLSEEILVSGCMVIERSMTGQA